MTRSLRLARRATVGGLALGVAGLLVLLGLAVSEVMANPGWSLVDGYWRGRLPWSPVGVGLVITGASVATIVGAATALLAGGPVRRALSALGLLVVAFWWLVDMLPPGQAVPCDPCPAAPGPDPVAMAYSTPEVTALLLLLSAVVLAALGLRAGHPSRGAVDP